MNPHEIRVSLYETQEQYLAVKKEWAKTKKHSALEHAAYNILRGYDPERGFTPITRKSRLDNGHGGVFFDWSIDANIRRRMSDPEMTIYKSTEGPYEEWVKITHEEWFRDTFGDIAFNTLEKAYAMVQFREKGND